LIAFALDIKMNNNIIEKNHNDDDEAKVCCTMTRSRGKNVVIISLTSIWMLFSFMNFTTYNKSLRYYPQEQNKNNNDSNGIAAATIEEDKEQQQREQQQVLRKLKDTTTTNTNTLSSSLRFLSFGSSRTYGAGLKEDVRDKLSYPALLNGTNMAIAGSVPEYPAMCLFSMISSDRNEDQVYDVITIEFLRNHESGALIDLGMRLRSRYPHAVIIFINHWAPREYYYKPENNKTLQQFHRERMTQRDDEDIFQVDVLDGTNEEDWLYVPYNSTIVQRAAQKCGGFVFEFPSKDILDSLRTYGYMYLSDMTHFSIMGHAYIRDQIINLLRSIQYNSSQSALGPWESKDYCDLWYKTGTLKNDNLRANNMEMKSFQLYENNNNNNNPSNTKYALEVNPNGGNTTTTPSSIELYNPWGTEAYLYLSYMAMGPNRMYPNALAQVFSSDSPNGTTPTASWIVRTQVPSYTSELLPPLHITMHWRIGPVNPGNSTLYLRILNNDNAVSYPNLRVVGIILSPHQYYVQRVSANF